VRWRSHLIVPGFPEGALSRVTDFQSLFLTRFCRLARKVEHRPFLPLSAKSASQILIQLEPKMWPHSSLTAEWSSPLLLTSSKLRRQIAHEAPSSSAEMTDSGCGVVEEVSFCPVENILSLMCDSFLDVVEERLGSVIQVH
jgi:hypothetical protein